MINAKTSNLQDIAQLAGVNVSTVSSILNGHAEERRIGKATTEKVMSIAERLNYRPNLLAQMLRSGKSRIICLITPNIASPTFSRMSRTIEELAAKNNYRVMTCTSDESDDNPEALIHSLLNYRPEGFIVVPTTRMRPTFFRLLENSEIPFVIADRTIAGLNTFQITFNNFQIGYLPTEHLIRQGFERIAILIAHAELNHIKERLAGYEAAMRKHNVRVRPPFIRFIPRENTAQASRDAIDSLLEWHPPVEAIIFTSNTVGLPALEQLATRGVKIPDRLKITGIETAPFYSLMSPPITAVDLNINELASRTFNAVMKLINEKTKLDKPIIETVEVSLIERKSSKSE